MEHTEELMVTGNEVVADLTPETLAPKTDNGLFKNITLGVGVAAGGALAIYGAYELGKKGVKFIRNLMEKRKESKEHPDYTYEKVEEAAKEMEETITKAKYRNKKEKHPMGFQYKG